jgi:hypothetical protein
MGAVRTSSERGKEGCHSLLLAFNDAKVNIGDWLDLLNQQIIDNLLLDVAFGMVAGYTFSNHCIHTLLRAR